MDTTLTHLGKKFDDEKIMAYFTTPIHKVGYIRLMTIDEIHDRIDREYKVSELALAQISAERNKT